MKTSLALHCALILTLTNSWAQQPERGAPPPPPPAAGEAPQAGAPGQPGQRPGAPGRGQFRRQSGSGGGDQAGPQQPGNLPPPNAQPPAPGAGPQPGFRPGPPPNGPQGPQPGQPFRPQAQNGTGQGGERPFVDMMRRRMDSGMERLSEEERQKVRQAMEGIWNQPKIKEARDQAAQSANRLREAIREAVVQADPSVRPMLEKMMLEQPGQPGQPGQPPMGQNRPNAPGQGAPQPGGEFRPEGRPQPERPRPQNPPATDATAGEPGGNRPLGDRALAMGLDGALVEKLTEDQRRSLREAMEKIRQRPEIQEARKAVETATPAERRGLFREMMNKVQTAMKETNPELAKTIEELRATLRPAGGEGGRGGERDRRPEGTAPPPQPGSEPAPGSPPPPGAPETKPQAP